MYIYYKFRIYSIKSMGLVELVGHLVSRCLYRVRLGVLPNSSSTTCTLKKFSKPVIYPIMSPPVANNN